MSVYVKKNNKQDDFDEANAQVLIEMLMDPNTTEAVRLKIVTEILDQSKDTSFWELMFQENMTLAKCPKCNHENHWLIPEEELSIMGWVTTEKDSRVPRHTNSEVCLTYEEACSKKKTTV